MEQLTDRIANVSLQTVLVILVGFTAARLAMRRGRAAWARPFVEIVESLLLATVLVFFLLRPFVVQSFFIPSGSMHPTLWEGDRILVNKLAFRFAAPERGQVIVFRAPPEADRRERNFIKRLIGVPGDVIEVQEGSVEVHDGTSRMVYRRDEVRAVLGSAAPVSAAETPEEPPLRLTAAAIWLGDRRVTPKEFAASAGMPGARVRIRPGRVLRNRQMLSESYVAEDPAYKWGPQRVPPGHYFMMGDNRNASQDSHYWGMLAADRVIGRADIVFWPFDHIKWIRHR